MQKNAFPAKTQQKKSVRTVESLWFIFPWFNARVEIHGRGMYVRHFNSPLFW
jgi:hypothetical protein